MDSVILDSLPSIHIALIGILIALYSVFAIYAYQKVNEFKEETERLVGDTKELIISIDRYKQGWPHPFESDGSINWQKNVETIGQDIRFEFSAIDDPSSFPSDAKAIEVGDRLVMVLRYLFSAYPFYSVSYYDLGEITKKVDDFKQADEPLSHTLSDERISEMRSRLLSILWLKKSNEEIFSAFLVSYIKALKEKVRSETRSCISKQDGHPMVEEHYMSAESKRLEKVDDIEKQILSAIDMCERYFEHTVVPLKKAYANYKLFSKRYRVTQLGRWTVRLVLFSFIVGVICPLLLERFNDFPPLSEIGYVWSVALELFILGASLGPYFYLISCLNANLKKSNVD